VTVETVEKVRPGPAVLWLDWLDVRGRDTIGDVTMDPCELRSPVVSWEPALGLIGITRPLMVWLCSWSLAYDDMDIVLSSWRSGTILPWAVVLFIGLLYCCCRKAWAGAT
jgi:hypothetical protein